MIFALEEAETGVKKVLFPSEKYSQNGEKVSLILEDNQVLPPCHIRHIFGQNTFKNHLFHDEL